MATGSLTDARTQFQELFHHGVLGVWSDGQLLDRFRTGDERSAEAVFAELVRRHGPMVMRVCRDALGDAHAAEDASQAVFLVLARRAGSVARRESLASWLYGVARRIAWRARREETRRRTHERRRAELMAQNATFLATPESYDELYRAIDRLPRIYRDSVVLCHLQGLSHEQAAVQLGCPLRTLQSRLLRARERLRQGLARRGVTSALVFPPIAPPMVPSAPWVEATARGARAFASGRAMSASAGIPPTTVALAESTLRTTTLVPAMTAAAILLTACLALLVVVSAHRGPDPGPTAEPAALVEPPAAAQAHEEPANRALDLRIVERETKAPLEGVEVTVEADSGARDGLGGDSRELTRLASDREGRCRVEFPRQLPKRIYITARKPGYAVRGYSPTTEHGGPIIPRAHTMELEHGVTIGGIVKRRDGLPIAGATVIISGRAGADLSPDYSYVHDATVTTDAQGRWQFAGMPPGWSYAYLRVTHPDYVPTLMQKNVPKPSDFELKARKAETILDDGVAVSGRVFDDQGRPLPNATVGLGADRQIMQRGFPSASTDAQGRFRFGHVPSGVATLTAQAPGRAPQLIDVAISPGMNPVEFRLGPGQVLRGRVVDREDKPLDGVTVQCMNWKGHASLDWTTRTDAQGRLAWDSAPPDPVRLTLTRPGYVMLGQREFQAGKGETSVTMYPPLRIRGKVVDARTGKPVSPFTVVHGSYYRDANADGRFRNVEWYRSEATQVATGNEYQVEFSHPLVGAVALRIEAEGYRPATSEPFKMEAGDATYDARLEPGAGPSGVVNGLDGRPLAGATVILSTRSLRAQLYNGKFHEGAYPQAVTGADSSFRFPPQTEPFRVFVDHAQGFAEADEKAIARSPHLAIHPWGRIEGLVKIGSRPAAGVQVRLSETDGRWAPDEAMPITQAQQLTTDARGHYAFERVLPARLSVSRIFTLERSSFHVGTGDSRTVRVEPAKTTWVDLGGIGRPVVGRFVLPTGIKPNAVFPYLNQTLTRIRPEPPYPNFLEGPLREAWLSEWLATDEGKAYDRSARVFDTNVRPDGRFRVVDVPAGKYTLQAQVNEPGKGLPGSYGPELARIEMEVVVPEIPGGRSDEPLDLGTIELKPAK